MTELATTPESNVIAKVPSIASQGLEEMTSWVQAMKAASEFAGFLSQTGMIPMSLKKKGKDSWKTPNELMADTTAVILAGMPLGLDPFQSTQNIFIVHGAPAMYARTMVGLVQAKGVEVEETESSPTVSTVRLRRTPDSEWRYASWPIQRAAAAGYTSNPKYKTNPAEMLYAKAATELCRKYCADILMGIYTPEEAEEYAFEDMGESPAPAPAAPTPGATRKISRPRKNAAPEPVAPEVIHDAPAEDEPEENVDTETGELPDEGTPAVLEVNYFDEITRLAGDKAGLRTLYGQAAAAGEPQDVLDAIASAGTAA